MGRIIYNNIMCPSDSVYESRVIFIRLGWVDLRHTPSKVIEDDKSYPILYELISVG